MSNRFNHNSNASDYARETTLEQIEDTLTNGILTVTVAGAGNSVDIIEIGGTAVGVNSGINSNGTQRVTIATDDQVNTTLTSINTDTTAINTDTTAINTDTTGILADTALMQPDITNIAIDINNIDNNLSAVISGSEMQVDIVSGAVTANAGTNLNTSLLALESGGNLAIISGDTTSIDNKTPSLGTALIASSVPITIGTDDTLLTENYNIRKNQTTSPIHYIRCVYSDFGAINTIHYLPDGFTGAEADLRNIINNANNQVQFSSSNSGDNGFEFRIIGYQLDGTPVSEFITLAADAQDVVTMSGTIFNINKFLKNDDPANIAGTIYCYLNGTSVTAGVPDEFLAQIPPGNDFNSSNLNHFKVPQNTTMILHKIIIKKLGGTLNHTVQLRSANNSVEDIYTGNTCLLNEWLADGHIIEEFGGDFIFSNTIYSNSVGIPFFFNVLSAGTDSTARLSIECFYSFL